MNWYYVKDGSRQGPVDQAEFERLVVTGEIRADSLVWRDGLGAWQRYDQVRAAAAAPMATGDRCSQCGRVQPAAEMVRFGDLWVCASCKPLYAQRLREGVAPVTQFNYAGFWIRFGARFVDGLLLFVVNMVFYAPMIFMSIKNPGQEPDAAMIAVTCVSYLLAFGFGIGYEVYFLGKSGATPGKKVCGIRVVMANGQGLTYGRATGRYFAQLLSGMTLGIGYIIAGFDVEKRSLHDHICGTRVIRT
jgi:uncharacterized RDD family membrane protein YckC